MDIGRLLWHLAIGITSTIVFLVLSMWMRTYRRLPPGPLGWPIVGSLLQLVEKPNESLFHLANKYGPLMCLSLGTRTVIVVSSAAMAKEVLKTHDRFLSGRPVTLAVECLSHYKSSLVWNQGGSHWRMLRRISNTELFSTKRIEALEHYRRDQILQTIQLILQESMKGKCINIEDVLAHSIFNLLGNMIFGKDMFDPHSPAFQEFKDCIVKLVVIGGSPSLGDYLPCVQLLDPQGVARNTRKYMKRAYAIFDQFMENRLATRGKTMGGTDGSKDLLDVLLDMRSEEFTLAHIRVYLTDIFLGGSDTTGKTVEWAMAELIRNPDKMKRAQAELDEMIGRNRMVEESDTDRLPYLRAVVKEVLRLHPAIPIVPRRAVSSCEIKGFVIPKDAEILVNVWGMGRDPQIWKEPLKFMPERFIDNEMSNMDYKGQHFELIPFGAGRRICVGLPLASRMIHVLLASLLHSFEWALPNSISADEMDMTEKFGATMTKVVTLEAIPSPRLPPDAY